jgi:hypothetical protein
MARGSSSFSETEFFFKASVDGFFVFLPVSAAY